MIDSGSSSPYGGPGRPLVRDATTLAAIGERVCKAFSESGRGTAARRPSFAPGCALEADTVGGDFGVSHGAASVLPADPHDKSRDTRVRASFSLRQRTGPCHL
jgi:hypothetical protein